MINWAFTWSSRRAPAWENCNDAMNLAVGPEWVFGEAYLPVNTRYTGSPLKRFKDDERIKLLNAPAVDQFEAEVFKYVIEENKSDYNLDVPSRTGQLILKEHTTLNVALTEQNSRVINLDEVYGYLQEYDWVALGIKFNNIEISDKSIMAKSFFYARDKSLKLVNLSGENQPYNDVPSIPAITYCVFKRTKNRGFVSCIVNPHLVSVPHMDSKIYDNKHNVFALDAFDATIEDYFLNPTILGSDINVINGNVIFTNVQFQLLEYEAGFHFIRNQSYIPFPRTIKSNHKIATVGNVITVTPTAHYGYISIEYDVDAMINSYGLASKVGKHKIEYTIIRG
jgi:hypothetical protein